MGIILNLVSDGSGGCGWVEMIIGEGGGGDL